MRLRLVPHRTIEYPIIDIANISQQLMADRENNSTDRFKGCRCKSPFPGTLNKVAHTVPWAEKAGECTAALWAQKPHCEYETVDDPNYSGLCTKNF